MSFEQCVQEIYNVKDETKVYRDEAHSLANQIATIDTPASTLFAKTVYVDEVNGDNLNDGSSNNPIKNIHLAIGMIPNGSYVNIVLLSDCTWSGNSVFSTNKYIEINLNGFTMNLKSYDASSDNSNKMVLYALLGYSNKVYFYGKNSSTSKIIIPPLLSGETISSSTSSIFIKSGLGGSPIQSLLHLAYSVEIVDNDAFYLIGANYSNFSFSAYSVTVTNNTGTRVLQDLVNGIIYDANGVPRNLQSNLIF